MHEICKCRVATSLYLEERGEGVSVEEGETPLDPPLWIEHLDEGCSTQGRI